jgi:hypothetical protein
VDAIPIEETEEIVTDGGVEMYWDDEDCPRVQCDGDLQQQDQSNVTCLECEEVWSHVKDDDEHLLVSAAGKIIKRKDRVATDGGMPNLEEIGVPRGEGESWEEAARRLRDRDRDGWSACACGARYRSTAAALACCDDRLDDLPGEPPAVGREFDGASDEAVERAVETSGPSLVGGGDQR